MSHVNDFSPWWIEARKERNIAKAVYWRRAEFPDSPTADLAEREERAYWANMGWLPTTGVNTRSVHVNWVRDAR